MYFIIIMNRIQKYQDSIERIFINKLYLKYLNKEDSENIINNIKKNEYIITIFLLSITNNINKKNKVHQHGYYIGSSFELALLLIRSLEKPNMYNINSDTFVKINNLVNILLSHNLELASSVLSKDKLLKSYTTCFKIMNSKISNSINLDFEINNGKFEYTDIINYKFNELKNIKNNLKKQKKLTFEEIKRYVENKYCPIIETASLFAWNLGGGQENYSIYIQKLGYYFAFLVKIYYDILELETDIKNTNLEYYPNIVINLGIQKTFEFYNFYKKKFIELSIKLDMFTNTLKELIEKMENCVDKFVENTIGDIREEEEIKI